MYAEFVLHSYFKHALDWLLVMWYVTVHNNTVYTLTLFVTIRTAYDLNVLQPCLCMLPGWIKPGLNHRKVLPKHTHFNLIIFYPLPILNYHLSISPPITVPYLLCTQWCCMAQWVALIRGLFMCSLHVDLYSCGAAPNTLVSSQVSKTCIIMQTGDSISPLGMSVRGNDVCVLYWWSVLGLFPAGKHSNTTWRHQ